MVKDASTKIKYIFNGKVAILLGDYVLRYQELLFKMYQYQILLKNMHKASQDFRLTIEEAQKRWMKNIIGKNYRKPLTI